MRFNIFSLVLIFALLSSYSHATAQHTHQSKYSGQEKREIKSLSESDIAELRNGGGWGFAKPAELNGLPGPAHLLEMKKEIGLSSEQIEKIEAHYGKMRAQAIILGVKYVALEKKLNDHFADGTITEKLLDDLLEHIAQVRKELRYVHLSTHLKTPAILTDEQIKHYNKLRGYSSNDPCKNIPKGHDPVKWKKHNNCP